jgi:hypothetical protein
VIASRCVQVAPDVGDAYLRKNESDCLSNQIGEPTGLATSLQHHRRKSESATTVRIAPTSSTPATSASMRKTSLEPNTWSMLPVRATTRGDPATTAQPRGLLHRSIVPGIRVLRRRRFDSSPRNPQVDIEKVAMSSTDRPSPREIWAAEH